MASVRSDEILGCLDPDRCMAPLNCRLTSKTCNLSYRIGVLLAHEGILILESGSGLGPDARSAAGRRRWNGEADPLWFRTGVRQSLASRSVPAGLKAGAARLN